MTSSLLQVNAIRSARGPGAFTRCVDISLRTRRVSLTTDAARPVDASRTRSGAAVTYDLLRDGGEECGLFFFELSGHEGVYGGFGGFFFE